MTAPGFHLTIPDDWVTSDLDTWLDEALDHARIEGDNGLNVGLVARARSAASARRPAAIYHPTTDTARAIGLVVTATLLGGRDDPMAIAKEAVVDRRASPLDGDASLLAWTSTSSVGVADAAARIAHRHYLTPVPGTSRRSALLVEGSYGIDRVTADVAATLDRLFDEIARTITWE